MKSNFVVNVGLLISLAAGLSACGLFNRNDAVSPHEARFQSDQELRTSLARSSGEVLYIRLKSLFPDATHNINDYIPDFSVGLNRALAQNERPITALAQVALKKKVNAFCKEPDVLDGKQGAKGSLFSREDILMPGESLPTDAVQAKVFVAVRNAWLAPYPANSPEITELTELYRQYRGSGAPESEANQALCIAVLSAAQFSIGGPGESDALRRAALEIGRRLPSFAEHADLATGKRTLKEIVRSYQTDPATRRSYFEAVNSWHREWLGLRPFLGGTDPRSDAHSGDSHSASRYVGITLGYAQKGNTVVRVNGVPLVTTRKEIGFPVEECSVTRSNGSGGTEPNIEPFDPRTKMLTWEMKNRGDNRWEILGGWVHQDRLPEYKAALAAYAGAAEANKVDSEAGFCILDVPSLTSAGGRNKAVNLPLNTPQYYKCKGLLKKQSGGFLSSSLEDFKKGSGQKGEIIAAQGPGGNFEFPAARQDPDDETVTIPANPLRQTVMWRFTSPWDFQNTDYDNHFTRSEVRIRRYSPTGVQNGVSKVRLWWSNQEVYMCNSLERFQHTCVYRPSSGSEYAAENAFWAGRPGIRPDSFTYIMRMGNPYLLNQMRCGQANKSLLSNASSIPDTFATYPFGYASDRSGYLAGSVNQAQLNDITINSFNMLTGFSSTDPETQALSRLRKDINDEPYRLLEHILENDRPYKELFTANYTLGREELELFLRSQGYYLPTYPPNYTPSSPQSPDRNQLRMIRFDQIPLLSSNYVTPEYTNFTAPTQTILGGVPAFGPRIDSTQELPNRPAAGILGMPALVGPVSQKMRTVAARYFTRLLCGSPAIFQPTGEEESLHQKFMLDPANSATSRTAAMHLDKKNQCYSCHVNLDPLGAALSPNFLRYVQQDDSRSMTGEMYGMTEYYKIKWLGAKWSPQKGTGAFLGKPARGLAEVAAILVDSPLWSQCVVQKTFENVYGRSVNLSDVNAIRSFVKQFESHQNYNELVRDMVDHPLYREGN